MIVLQWPLALALLPLPLLVRLLMPAVPLRRDGALAVPFFAALAQAGAVDAGRRGRRILRLALMSLVWALLVLAAARPALEGAPLPVETEGRDLMLVLDVSISMAAPDIPVAGAPPSERLRAAKLALDAFIAERPGDRIGLVLYGTRAVLQAPLTLDHRTLRALLSEATPGMANDPRMGGDSALGDGIGLALKRLRERRAEDRFLVLVAGSAGDSGALSPMLAAEIAKAEGIRIHSVGVASDATLPGIPRAIPLYLDETLVGEVTNAAGGDYFRARTAEDIEGALAEIGRREPVKGAAQYFTPVTALFYWPLGAAVSLSLLFAGLLLLPRGRRASAGSVA